MVGFKGDSFLSSDLYTPNTLTSVLLYYISRIVNVSNFSVAIEATNMQLAAP